MKFTFRSLSHENILQFVGFHNEKEKKKLWLITEFVDGGSMRRFCKKQQKDNNTDGVDEQLTLDKKLYIATCCWRGLDYLHSNNVCHKDISPDNILVLNIYICLFSFSANDIHWLLYFLRYRKIYQWLKYLISDWPKLNN